MTARLRDVAEHAGVSISLVSRVLNDTPGARVAEATRDRVVRAAEKLSYRPHQAARTLRTRRTSTIAVILPDVNNAMSSELVRGIEDRTSESGYTMLLGRSETIDGPGRLAGMVADGHVDGVIFQPEDTARPAAVRSLVADATVVLIHSRADGLADSILLDDIGAAETATRHLIDHGHRRIALVNGLSYLVTARRREQGYRSALEAAGLPVSARLVTRLGYHAQDARPALDRLFDRRGRPPTAAVVSNVNAGIGLLTAARDRGLRVPEDLSVIALHDSWLCDHLSPSLTTVRTPMYELGVGAAELLIERLSRPRPPVEVEVPVLGHQVVVRGSVARVAG